MPEEVTLAQVLGTDDPESQVSLVKGLMQEKNTTTCVIVRNGSSTPIVSITRSDGQPMGFISAYELLDEARRAIMQQERLAMLNRTHAPVPGSDE